jgi:streptogramin lyase
VKYFAFLSYSHDDAKVAASLSRFIETFRVPVKLGGKEQLPKRMFPVFRDRDEVSTSPDLGGVIKAALADSGALIVLCSPSAAKSVWVNEEIRTFKQTPNASRIFPVLVSGEPQTAFPSALTEGGVEPLAVDLRPGHDKPKDARLRLAAGLLGVNFDSLKRREAARIRNTQLRFAAAAVILAAVAGLWYSDQPHYSKLTTFGGTVQAAAAAPDGSLWLSEYFPGGSSETDLVRVSPAGAVKVYRTGSNVPGIGDVAIGALAVGDDGIWLQGGTLMLARFSPSTGKLREFNTAGIDSFTPARGGGVWFVRNNGAFITRILADGTKRDYPVPAQFTAANLTTARDGTLWFSTISVIKDVSGVGHVTQDGRIVQYISPTINASVGGVAIGPDGNVWFTEGRQTQVGPPGRIARLAPGGKIAEYTISDESNPEAIVADKKSLWFGDGSSIGHATPDGKIAIYPIPGGDVAQSLTVGPDGALWYIATGASATDTGGNTIERVTPDGHITRYPLPNSDTTTYLAAAQGRSFWFSEAHAVGRLYVGHWLFGM